MPLPEFATEAEIPEAFRPEYEKGEDGKFRAKVAAVPDVAGLTSALASERTKASDAEKARKAAERERDELKRAADAKTNNISDDQLKRLSDEDAAKRKVLEDKIAEQEAVIKAGEKQQKYTNVLKAALKEAGVMQDGREEEALTALEKRSQFGDEGLIRILDENGQPTTTTLKDFLAGEFRQRKSYLFKGTGSSGSGATGSDTSGGTASNYDPEKAGKAMAAQQKVSGANNLAFK